MQHYVMGSVGRPLSRDAYKSRNCIDTCIISRLAQIVVLTVPNGTELETLPKQSSELFTLPVAPTGDTIA